MSELPASASPPYAWQQLERAIERAGSGADRQSRERASRKAEVWRLVISGMQSGELLIGSRTPVADTPVWVTLEVVHGGLASGRYLAERPLTPAETELVASIGDGMPPGVTDRERLNLWCLTDAGQERLGVALGTGAFEVEIPEESALLVVTWLLAQQEFEAALDLVAELRPLMHRLRFSPDLRSSSRPRGATVRLATVGEVTAPLRHATPNPRVAAQLATLRTWNPLYDKLVALWSRTVDGDPPKLDDRGQVHGGWPCARWADDWASERDHWLDEFRSAATTTAFQGRHAHPKSNFSRLLHALERAADGGVRLTAADAGWVRRALANTNSRNGTSGSEQRAALRAAQLQLASLPSHASLARVLAGRLDAYPRDGGLPFLDPLAADVTEEEGAFAAPGSAMPSHLVRKLERALEAPAADLVARGVITSGDVLARILPQVNSRILASSLTDDALRGVFEQTYAAFRRRRSLLLLNLEHQIQLEELPWVAAMSPFRQATANTSGASQTALRESALLALSSFPQAILPNPLIRELGALAQVAGMTLPLVEEVAADIFMGTFTKKWRMAAIMTSERLDDTIYARYFDLPKAEAWRDATEQSPRRRRCRSAESRTSEDFAKLCRERATEAEAGEGQGSFVATNGAILEQSQILTSHNLAVLTAELKLQPELASMGGQLATECLAWISGRHLQPQVSWHSHLINVKNCAYALRQAVFFLSFIEDRPASQVADHWNDAIRSDTRLQALQPVGAGLVHVTRGGRFDDAGRVDGSNERRLLGWAVGRHWLSPSSPPRE